MSRRSPRPSGRRPPTALEPPSPGRSPRPPGPHSHPRPLALRTATAPRGQVPARRRTSPGTPGRKTQPADPRRSHSPTSRLTELRGDRHTPQKARLSPLNSPPPRLARPHGNTTPARAQKAEAGSRGDLLHRRRVGRGGAGWGGPPASRLLAGSELIGSLPQGRGRGARWGGVGWDLGVA